MLAIRSPLFAALTTPFENAWDRESTPAWRWQSFAPPADVRETKETYVIELDVPGLAESDIQVTLENKHLTLKGERKLVEDANFSRQERAFGCFERVFHLPDDADAGRIEAATRNGVLTVKIPKHEAARPKTIEVKSA